MPARYKILPSLNLKYVKISGKTNLGEHIDVLRAYFADPDFHPDQRHLVDLSKLEDAALSFSNLIVFKAFFDKNAPPRTRPISVAIAAPTSLGYGLARMFTSLMSSEEIMDVNLFHTLPEACDWLGFSCETLTAQADGF